MTDTDGLNAGQGSKSRVEYFRLGFSIERQERPIELLRAGTGIGDSDFFREMGIPLLFVVSRPAWRGS